jgi:late competence protein required for DNA uptake (superfamily II DNA/RNA helicase)
MVQQFFFRLIRQRTDKIMECFVCGKVLNSGFLCDEHAMQLHGMLNNEESIVMDSTWKNHCMICGEYENRRIVYLPDAGYFCEYCILEEFKRIKDDLLSPPDR